MAGRTDDRVQLALRLLAEAGGTLPSAELWTQVAERIPLSDAESSKTATSDRTRAEIDYRFTTAQMVKAGWMLKRGAEGWTITEAGLTALADHPDSQDLSRVARELYTAWSSQRSEERSASLNREIIPQNASQETVLRAASTFVQRGLLAGESVFVPGKALWTPEVADELDRVFTQSDGEVGEGFLGKLGAQLADASDDARLLMAELVMLQVLPSMGSIGETRKRERVTAVLAMMAHPVQIPAELDAAFVGGSFNPGTRMSSNLGAAMTIVVNFVGAWVRLDDERRIELLEDPWEMRKFVREIPGEPFPSQRYSLLYLLHPGSFVAIVSTDHLRAIHETFVGELLEPTADLDMDVKAITIALQVKLDGPTKFYSEPLYSQWASRPPAKEQDRDGGTETPSTDERAVRPAFAPATDALAARLFMDGQWLQDALDLLERRKQLILFGPPGTGKTFVARALARHIAGDRDSMLVQFHPSYSYEDFVEGYRPATSDAGLVYELKEGPFRRIAREAAQNPDRNYVLVIDEINRGNLAKIFGELYFLLEYRDERIALLYGSDADFALPANVFIIGTMNTTDRSIALLDAAMRRRFAFLELHPDVPPTADVLRRWLEARGISDEPARLLDAMNELIVDRGSRIGPSYLMPSDGDLSERRLRQIWEFELLPLLEEYHYGEGKDVAREYGLDTLRRGLT